MAKPAETPAKAEVEVKFDPESVDSFAGAYLAAFTADSDGDYKHAIELYRVALDFEPNNLQIQERLMINLFLNGDFDDGVKLAQTLKKDPAVERVTTLSLGIDAIRQKQFSKARKLLVYKGPNDLDRMMNSLLVAWADFGAGKKKEALDSIVNLNGPRVVQDLQELSCRRDVGAGGRQGRTPASI